jgi:hypothetical protein
MTYSVVKDLADILQSNGLGVFGTSIFIGKEPMSPSETITLYAYGGESPVPNLRLDYPNVQIRVRGAVNGYVAAEQVMQNIKNALTRLGRETINTNLYVGFWQKGDTIFLKHDEKERPIFVSNWKIAVQPNVTDNRDQLG